MIKNFSPALNVISGVDHFSVQKSECYVGAQRNLTFFMFYYFISSAKMYFRIIKLIICILLLFHS